MSVNKNVTVPAGNPEFISEPPCDDVIPDIVLEAFNVGE
jgi:hypothetical protein